MGNHSVFGERPSWYYTVTRREMLKYIPNGSRRILDVGCGNGGFGDIIKQYLRIEVWGIDVEEKAIEFAKEKLDNAILGDFLLSNSLPDEYFDVICFNDVLEHMADPYSALKISCKYLSDKGVIIGSVPNVRHISIIRNLLINKDWEYTAAGIMDFGHLRFFTMKSLRNALEKLDFEILCLERIKPTEKKLFNIIPISLSWMSDMGFEQIAFVAKPVARKRLI
jgi:SAM-dependent methyltransferase